MPHPIVQLFATEERDARFYDLLRDLDSGDGEGLVEFDATLMEEFMVQRAAIVETMMPLRQSLQLSEGLPLHDVFSAAFGSGNSSPRLC